MQNDKIRTPIAYLSLPIRSCLNACILAELGCTSRLSERFYSERISSTLCKSLDSKHKRGIILRGSNYRPLTALVLLDRIAGSLVILAPVKLYLTCRNCRTSKLCNIRYISCSDYSYITAEWFLYLNSRRQVQS